MLIIEINLLTFRIRKINDILLKFVNIRNLSHLILNQLISY